MLMYSHSDFFFIAANPTIYASESVLFLIEILDMKNIIISFNLKTLFV